MVWAVNSLECGGQAAFILQSNGWTDHVAATDGRSTDNRYSVEGSESDGYPDRRRPR